MGTELEKVTVPRGQLDVLIEAYGENLAAVMPKHVSVDTFIGLAVAYIRRDDWLMQAARANQLGLILALRECAAHGHVLQKGTAALVAYRSSKDGDNGWSITYLEEVAGVIERMYRSGGVRSVHHNIIRDKDLSRWQQTTMILPYHEYDENASPAERGPLKAVYAYARLLSGDWSQVIYLNRHAIGKYRGMSKTATSTRGAPGGNFWGPEWPLEGPNTEAMWVKTALHRLERLVPTSAAYRWEIAQAEAAAARDPRLPDAPLHTPEYVDVQDAEIVPERPAQPAARGTRAATKTSTDNAEGWPDTATPGGSKK